MRIRWLPFVFVLGLHDTTDDFEAVESEVDECASRVSDLEDKNSELRTQLEDLETKATETDQKVEDLEQRLNVLEAR